MPHEKLQCSQPCQRQLRCGHACRMACGAKCRCAVDCAAFQGIPLPPDQIQSVPTQSLEAWTAYNARADDRRLATAQQTTVEAADLLVDAPHTYEASLVDAFRPVTLTPEGTRAVGDQVVVNSSASVSPSKSTDDWQVIASQSSTSSAKSSTVSASNLAKTPVSRRPRIARASNNTGRRRRAPVSIVPPVKLTLSAAGAKDPSPVIAEWERRDEEEGLKVNGQSAAVLEQVHHEGKNLIDFD